MKNDSFYTRLFGQNFHNLMWIQLAIDNTSFEDKPHGFGQGRILIPAPNHTYYLPGTRNNLMTNINVQPPSCLYNCSIHLMANVCGWLPVPVSRCRVNTEKVGSDSRGEVWLIFYLELTRGSRPNKKNCGRRNTIPFRIPL